MIEFAIYSKRLKASTRAHTRELPDTNATDVEEAEHAGSKFFVSVSDD